MQNEIEYLIYSLPTLKVLMPRVELDSALSRARIDSGKRIIIISYPGIRISYNIVFQF